MPIEFNGIIKGKTKEEIEIIIKEKIPNIASARWISNTDPGKPGKHLLKISSIHALDGKVLELLNEMAGAKIIEEEIIDDVIFDEISHEEKMKMPETKQVFTINTENKRAHSILVFMEELISMVIGFDKIKDSTTEETTKAVKEIKEVVGQQLKQDVEKDSAALKEALTKLTALEQQMALLAPVLLTLTGALEGIGKAAEKAKEAKLPGSSSQ